jgi:hypothetical protein
MADEKRPPYAILGIHGNDVRTIEGDVARVRFFVGDRIVDEDHELPPLGPGVPATMEMYDMVMRHDLLKRAEELVEVKKK